MCIHLPGPGGGEDGEDSEARGLGGVADDQGRVHAGGLFVYLFGWLVARSIDCHPSINPSPHSSIHPPPMRQQRNTRPKQNVKSQRRLTSSCRKSSSAWTSRPILVKTFTTAADADAERPLESISARAREDCGAEPPGQKTWLVLCVWS